MHLPLPPGVYCHSFSTSPAVGRGTGPSARPDQPPTTTPRAGVRGTRGPTWRADRRGPGAIAKARRNGSKEPPKARHQTRGEKDRNPSARRSPAEPQWGPAGARDKPPAYLRRSPAFLPALLDGQRGGGPSAPRRYCDGAHWQGLQGFEEARGRRSRPRRLLAARDGLAGRAGASLTFPLIHCQASGVSIGFGNCTLDRSSTDIFPGPSRSSRSASGIPSVVSSSRRKYSM